MNTHAGKSIFLELARITNNRRLRKVYVKQYARYVLKQTKAAL